MTKMIIKQEEFINGVKVLLIFCYFPPSPTMPPPPSSLFLWQYFLHWMREMKNSWINVCVFAFFLCVIFNFPAISFVELGFSPSFINKLWKCLYGCDIVWLMIFHLKEINYNSFAIFCCWCEVPGIYLHISVWKPSSVEIMSRRRKKLHFVGFQVWKSRKYLIKR